MQPNNENADAAPGMSEVPRIGDADSLRDVQRERMERGQQHHLPDMPGQGLRLDEPPWTLKPSIYRFYIAAVGMGMAVGISWTILMIDTKLMQRYISHHHAIAALYGFVAIAFVLQTIHIIIETRRINRTQAKLKEFYETVNKRSEEFCVERGIEIPK